MLESLNWPSLESRNRIGRLQTFYKGINNFSGLSIPPYFLSTHQFTRHHHTHQFIQLSARTSYYQYSYITIAILLRSSTTCRYPVLNQKILIHLLICQLCIIVGSFCYTYHCTIQAIMIELFIGEPIIVQNKMSCGYHGLRL